MRACSFVCARLSQYVIGSFLVLVVVIFGVLARLYVGYTFAGPHRPRVFGGRPAVPLGG